MKKRGIQERDLVSRAHNARHQYNKEHNPMTQVHSDMVKFISKNNKRRGTIAIIVDHDTKQFTAATSLCELMDKFDRTKGVDIATIRGVRALDRQIPPGIHKSLKIEVQDFIQHAHKRYKDYKYLGE